MTQGLEALVKLAADREFRDVLVPGYLDYDLGPVPQFRPNPDHVYLEMDEGLIRADLESRDLQLQLELVAAIVPTPPPWLADEDLEYGLSSYDQMVFAEDEHVRLHHVRGVVTAGSSLEAGRVKCMEFQFSGGHRLFLDPEWIFGIRLGLAGAFEEWAERQLPCLPDGRIFELDV